MTEPAALPSGEAQAARRAAEAADSANEPAPVAVTPLTAFLLEQQSGKGDRGRTGQQVGSALTQSIRSCGHRRKHVLTTVIEAVHVGPYSWTAVCVTVCGGNACAIACNLQTMACTGRLRLVIWHAQQWEFVMAGGSPAQSFLLHRAWERMLRYLSIDTYVLIEDACARCSSQEPSLAQSAEPGHEVLLRSCLSDSQHRLRLRPGACPCALGDCLARRPAPPRGACHAQGC